MEGWVVHKRESGCLQLENGKSGRSHIKCWSCRQDTEPARSLIVGFVENEIQSTTEYFKAEEKVV